MRTGFLAMLCLALVFLAGCNAVGGFFGLADDIHRRLNPPPGKAAIGEQKVVVLPFAPLDVRQGHPDIEREVATVLVRDMKEIYPNATFVSADALLAWQDKTPNWRGMDASRIGKAFEADLVIEINVMEFKTRDRPDSMMLQGLIEWEARAFTVETDERVWQMGRSRVRWPRKAIHTVGEIPEDLIKRGVIREFAWRFNDRFVQEFKG